MTGCHETGLEPRDGVPGIGILDDLFAVSVPTPEHVVAVGYWGAAYVSFDGGKQWQRGETKTRSLINDVSMADNERGFAVGQRGLLLRTDDGGLHWETLPNPKKGLAVHFFSVHALDANRVWIVGEWGTRLYSDDGGETFRDESLVIEPGHPQFVWLSVDDQERIRGGEDVFEDITLTDVWCLAKTEHCWITGEFGTVYFSERGGIPPVDRPDEPGWQLGEILADGKPEPVEMGDGVTELSGEQIAALEAYAATLTEQPHLVIAIQPRLSASEVASYRPGGDPYPLFELIDARSQSIQFALEGAGLLSDRIRQRGVPPWDFEDFIEDDPEILKRWLEGRQSESARVDLEIAQSPYLFSVRFSDPRNGTVAALGGVVMRSEDGGRTWRYTEVGRKAAVFATAPQSGQRALAFGEKGLARVTTDSGDTWVRPDAGFPKLFTYYRDTGFAGETGYLVGQAGFVLRTDDAGATWRQVLPPPRS